MSCQPKQIKKPKNLRTQQELQEHQATQQPSATTLQPQSPSATPAVFTADHFIASQQARLPEKPKTPLNFSIFTSKTKI
ncbi:hypothetical protein CCACVL1_22580 [Corchorus capsularis]|uniref:Uncharacterized protein n=1 Tax=Corchorus capsularis TaxID=210143 RepID=A0A1R3GXU1_COCAP|nr:hypothetical protein CCACVL1_22580 [Corchorus capsularis]